MTWHEAKLYIKSCLVNIYEEKEARFLAQICLTEVSGRSNAQLLLHEKEPMSELHLSRLNALTRDLVSGNPWQYVLGKVEFMGLELEITPAVLIPRPETEELVQHIVQQHAQESSPVHIADICTGSGCIAIALAHSLKSKVYALDVSTEALAIAERNAFKNQVSIQFECLDILTQMPHILPQSLDIVVSNPPYVRHQEMKMMQKNVLEFEPPLALFVEDENPLVFYQRINQLAFEWLKPEGYLYFEINQYLGAEILSLVHQTGFARSEILLDYKGNERFVIAKK